MATLVQTPDVLVIGLGAMGSATLLHLARQGIAATGIDQYAPPHSLGSTHGESRITREAVGEGAAFVPLARRSHELWRQLERESGRPLLEACGGLIISRTGLKSQLHEQTHFFGKTLMLARQFRIAHDVLDAATLASRFPQLTFVGDETGYFEPGAGYLRVEDCVTEELAAARQLGANIRTGERVRHIRLDGTKARVETDLATYAAGTTIVCAGPWLPGLLGDAVPQPLVVRRQTMHWFAPDDSSAYDSANFPIFIWNWGDGPADVFYGFPNTRLGLKVATEQMHDGTLPDTVDREVSAAESAAMHATHVQGRLRQVSARRTHAVVCLYTCAPGAHFLIDRLPDHDGVIVVSACSGHGFKHSPAIGEAAASFALTGTRPAVLEPFRFRVS